MNRKQFRESLYKGLGSALLYLKEHPSKASKYTDVIYNACIYSTKFDPQCEQSRVKYLLEAIDISQNSAILQEKILKAIKLRNDGLDLPQIYELVKHFAESGNHNAKQYMKQEFAYNDEYDGFVGAEEIIELEDIDGLLFVADIIGKKMNEDSSYSGEFFLASFIKERFRNEIISQLIKENKSNENIITFLEDVLSDKSERKPNTKEIEPYYKIREIIDKHEDIPLHRFMIWGRKASDEDLKMAAMDLLNEDDEKKLVSYLYIFRGRVFPVELTRVIELAKSLNEKISEAAVFVLSKSKDNRIHELAVTILKEKPNRHDVISLLELNYCDDDYKILEKILFMNNNKEDIHSIGLGIIKVFNENPTKHCLKIMEYLYEKSYCTVCRESSIDIMIENNIIPKWILNQAKYDCNFDIRQMVSKYMLQ